MVYYISIFDNSNLDKNGIIRIVAKRAIHYELLFFCQFLLTVERNRLSCSCEEYRVRPTETWCGLNLI